MNADEFAARASRVYGPQWQTALANDLRNAHGAAINLRTIQRWAADGVPNVRSNWLRGHLQAIETHRSEADTIRRIYLAFKSGAGLCSNDVAELFDAAGLALSNNRLRELSRNSDRGSPITAAELLALVSIWAARVREP